jgi:periplasmic protein TonB
VKFATALRQALLLLCVATASGCTSTQDNKAAMNAEAVKTSARAANETVPARTLPRQEDKTHSEAIARLKAAIAKEYDSYRQYPRREYVGSSTSGQHKKYVDVCLEKIYKSSEKVMSTLRGYEVNSSVQITFSVQQSGMIEKIDVNRSSGNKGFDEAVRKLIKSNEPFPEFSAEMKARLDILSVTSSFGLASQNLP